MIKQAYLRTHLINSMDGVEPQFNLKNNQNKLNKKNQTKTKSE